MTDFQDVEAKCISLLQVDESSNTSGGSDSGCDALSSRSPEPKAHRGRKSSIPNIPISLLRRSSRDRAPSLRCIQGAQLGLNECFGTSSSKRESQQPAEDTPPPKQVRREIKKAKTEDEGIPVESHERRHTSSEMDADKVSR